MQYLGSGDITRTDINPDGTFNTNTTGTFSSYYAAYNLAYGQTVTDKLALGVTGKMIRAKIDDVTANAYAVDLGSMYKLQSNMTLAATLTNIGTKLTFINDGDPLPMALHVGAAYRPTRLWLAASEVVYRRNGLASFHIGGQWRPIEMISLRVGYRTDTLNGLSAYAGLTIGLGLHVWGQEFAYAWAPYGDLGDAQYFSLLLRFGAPGEAKRNLVHYQAIKKHRTVELEDSGTEIEQRQLMELFSNEDFHVAQSSSAERSMGK